MLPLDKKEDMAKQVRAIEKRLDVIKRTEQKLEAVDKFNGRLAELDKGVSNTEGWLKEIRCCQMGLSTLIGKSFILFHQCGGIRILAFPRKFAPVKSEGSVASFSTRLPYSSFGKGTDQRWPLLLLPIGGATKQKGQSKHIRIIFMVCKCT